MNAKAGRFEVKVYYEDVDSLSVVYYANYLKYLERGRSEFFADAGFAPWSLNDQGVLVAVYKADLTFSCGPRSERRPRRHSAGEGLGHPGLPRSRPQAP
jgi:acyl-CoA thioesterase FadM